MTTANQDPTDRPHNDRRECPAGQRPPIDGRQQDTVRTSHLRALVYLPTAAAIEAGAACIEYAEQSGYEVVGVVAERWTAAAAAMYGDVADIIIVAARSHLPSDRLPRIVSVEEEMIARPPAPSSRPGQRRPKHLT